MVRFLSAKIFDIFISYAVTKEDVREETMFCKTLKNQIRYVIEWRFRLLSVVFLIRKVAYLLICLIKTTNIITCLKK